MQIASCDWGTFHFPILAVNLNLCKLVLLIWTMYFRCLENDVWVSVSNDKVFYVLGEIHWKQNPWVLACGYSRLPSGGCGRCLYPQAIPVCAHSFATLSEGIFVDGISELGTQMMSNFPWDEPGFRGGTVGDSTAFQIHFCCVHALTL